MQLSGRSRPTGQPVHPCPTLPSAGSHRSSMTTLFDLLRLGHRCVSRGSGHVPSAACLAIRRSLAAWSPTDVYMWTLRHSHRRHDGGRSADCREVLTLSPQPAGTGGPLRVVFADGLGRYVPGGAYSGSGGVGLGRFLRITENWPACCEARASEGAGMALVMELRQGVSASRTGRKPGTRPPAGLLERSVDDND